MNNEIAKRIQEILENQPDFYNAFTITIATRNDLNMPKEVKEWIEKNCTIDPDDFCYRGFSKIREVGDGSDYYKWYGMVVGFNFSFATLKDATAFKLKYANNSIWFDF